MPPAFPAAPSKSPERIKFEEERTKRLMRIWQYNYIFSPIGLVVCFLILYPLTSTYLLINTRIDATVWWTPDTLLCVLIGGVGQLACVVPFGTAIALCWPIRPWAYREKKVVRPLGTLYVALVTRGENVQTIINTISRWPALTKLFPPTTTSDPNDTNKAKTRNIQFTIILDSTPTATTLLPHLPPFVRVITVPSSFTPPNGGKYKARALEYARREFGLGESDWVLHLDEETEIDAFGLRACVEFAEGSGRDVGMGTLFYNTRSHWHNPFYTTAELTRVIGDFGGFRLPLALYNRPYSGWLHGSFILVRGAVENAVTWDTECLAEDFWFGLQAARLSYTFGWIEALAREQPPRTLPDLFRQRVRWFSGIWSCNSSLTRLSYILTIFYLMGVLHTLYVILLRETPLVLPRWMLLWAVAAASEGVWAAAFCSVSQDFDEGGVGAWAVLGHVGCAVLGVPCYRLFECGVLGWAVLRPPRGFYVVKKV
ncbi:glycosyltransferase family 2 protein [Aulographum hederae CBS 113979]|uniref:Glycosyltransferase family 2 protein n=1 Tax=Aulographum hederae CBS 113979 TaxID=1176131 RepID=A0A6G1GU15_9PEZI|nr:glycosyltransferase family 2 protein [Aulographum hederae CBS 113979]